MTQEDYKGIARELFKLIKPMLKREMESPQRNVDPTEQLIDQNGLAELLKVHPNTLHGKTDIYPSVMVGKRKRFLKNRVIAMLANQ